MIESPHNHLATPEQALPWTQRSAGVARSARLQANRRLERAGMLATRRARTTTPSLAHEQLLAKRTQVGRSTSTSSVIPSRGAGAPATAVGRTCTRNWQREFQRLECRGLRLGRRQDAAHPLAPAERRARWRESQSRRADGGHEQRRAVHAAGRCRATGRGRRRRRGRQGNQRSASARRTCWCRRALQPATARPRRLRRPRAGCSTSWNRPLHQRRSWDSRRRGSPFCSHRRCAVVLSAPEVAAFQLLRLPVTARIGMCFVARPPAPRIAHEIRRSTTTARARHIEL